MRPRAKYPAHVQAAIDAAVSDQDARIPRARRLELALPFPPSVNNLYETVAMRDGRLLRKKSKRGKFYESAVSSALAAWKREHALRPPSPPYALTLYVYPPRDRRKHDLSNLMKAPEDALFAAIGQDDNDVTLVVARKFDPSAEPRIVLILEGSGER